MGRPPEAQAISRTLMTLLGVVFVVSCVAFGGGRVDGSLQVFNALIPTCWGWRRSSPAASRSSATSSGRRCAGR